MTADEVIAEAFRQLIEEKTRHNPGTKVVHRSCPRYCDFVSYEGEEAILSDLQDGKDVEIRVPAAEVVDAAKLKHYASCIHAGVRTSTLIADL